MDTLHGVPGDIGTHILGGIIILLGAGKGGPAIIPNHHPGLINFKGPGQHGQQGCLPPGPHFHFKQAKDIPHRKPCHLCPILTHMPGRQGQPPIMGSEGGGRE